MKHHFMKSWKKPKSRSGINDAFGSYSSPSPLPGALFQAGLQKSLESANQTALWSGTEQGERSPVARRQGPSWGVAFMEMVG